MSAEEKAACIGRMVEKRNELQGKLNGLEVTAGEMQDQLRAVTSALGSPATGDVTTGEDTILMWDEGGTKRMPYPPMQKVANALQEIRQLSQEIAKMDERLKKVNVKMINE